MIDKKLITPSSGTSSRAARVAFLYIQHRRLQQTNAVTTVPLPKTTEMICRSSATAVRRCGSRLNQVYGAAVFLAPPIEQNTTL